jgi:hypothetical protein
VTTDRAMMLTGGVALTIMMLAAHAAAGPPEPATAEEIAALLATAGDAADYDNAALLYVLDEADIYVQESGLATTESCLVIKILTDAGVRSQSVLRDDYDPDTNRVATRSVRIHRADGSIDDVDLSRMVTQPTTQHSIYWGGEQHLLSLPRLEIGDAVEIRRSKIGFNIAYLAGDGFAEAANELQPPMEGHWYEVTEFQGGYPILLKRYSVHMPPGMPIQYEVYNGSLQSSLWFGETAHVYTFRAEDVPPVKREAHMVATSDCVPKLVMATVPDWETKSRWFYQVNEPQFEADEAIEETVARITEGLDEEGAIAACLHWVADNIRYYGTSRGPREGFTLHRGIETFHDKGGVCKDIAGMLVTMLRVLGHEVYPALTMAGSRVEAIPADQFNHTVCVMRYPDGRFRILDPTWSPTSKEIWSSREALQGLVYGTPEGQPQTLSPYFSPDENMLHVRSASALDEDGTLTCEVRMDMTGYPCTYLRRYANRDRPFDQRGRFEASLNIAPNAQIVSLAHIEPRDYSRDGWLEMTVRAPRYARGEGEASLFRLPMMRHPFSSMFLRDLFYGFREAQRDHALRMRATRWVLYEETIALPDGWAVIDAPPARTIQSEAATLDFEISPGEGALTYRFELTLKDHIIAPERYGGFKEVIDAMLAIGDAWIVCGGGQSATGGMANRSTGAAGRTDER